MLESSFGKRRIDCRRTPVRSASERSEMVPDAWKTWGRPVETLGLLLTRLRRSLGAVLKVSHLCWQSIRT